MTKQLFIPKLKKVNRYTRAGNNGKVIVCPECNHHQEVYHFSEVKSIYLNISIIIKDTLIQNAIVDKKQ